jgi:NADH:ubiquinone oxidoreductase subunit F (NADH-binding)/NAD-dependent dihydropyrimidine dehydrogenase PreA subunit
MGTTLREIVEKIGGGVPDGRRFKAVQIGGPSGGCVPASLAGTEVDFDALTEAGAMMGSGGLVVLDNTDCMVDVARYFMTFTQQESCGKCSFCRVGTRRILDILERLCAGTGTTADLDELERLSIMVRSGSQCGLGRTAPNPVLSTLTHFRDEYEAHVQGRCPAGTCRALIRFEINENCIGCAQCARNCPVEAIEPLPYRRHRIDPERCIRCGACLKGCPKNAVEVV